MSRDLVLQKILPLLNQRETKAYEYWAASNKPALAPSLQAKMFNLWLEGKQCEEIRRLNPQFQLGEIVAARIEGQWDERREEHLDQLLKATSLRVQQATLQTADFVCDLFAVANREHGDRLRRYLQSGDERDLGDFRITSLTGFKTAVEVLQKLTGQERQSTQKVNISGEVFHKPDLTLSTKPLPAPQDAASVLKLLLGKEELK